jgi:hypothetical protein
VSTVAEIQSAIEGLSPQERRELAAWFEKRHATLKANASPAGMLARYARPKHKRTVGQSVGKYLGDRAAAPRDH